MAKKTNKNPKVLDKEGVSNFKTPEDHVKLLKSVMDSTGFDAAYKRAVETGAVVYGKKEE